MALGAGQTNGRTGISVKTSRALAHYAMPTLVFSPTIAGTSPAHRPAPAPSHDAVRHRGCNANRGSGIRVPVLTGR